MRQSTDVELVLKALVTAQGQYPTVPKTAENPFFHSTYADLASCVEAAKPVNKANGLAVVQMTASVDGKPVLTSRLCHSSGQWLEDDMPLFLGKQDAQSLGSALTYARRYAYCAILGLVADSDDDGNQATKSAADAFEAAIPAEDPVGWQGILRRMKQLNPENQKLLEATLEANGIPKAPGKMSSDQLQAVHVELLAYEGLSG